MTYVLAFIVGMLLTEVIGYAVHRLIHSGRVKWLENSHMEHHEIHYASGAKQLSTFYRYPTRHRSFLGVGLEWLIPITLVALPGIVVAYLMGTGVLLIVTTIVGSLAWAWFAMDYSHKVMHLTWTPLLRFRWFKRRRRLHHLHHQGRMDTNYGILFHGLDRLFGTYRGA